MKGQLKMIDMSLVTEPSEAIRGSIDMDKIRELAESIREKGLLQAILVRPKNGKFEVVWGHRRYLAHRLINATAIKAEVREISEEDTLILRATENLQREDLTPMEEARTYGLLRDRLHYTIESTARHMGKNRNTIKRYLDLLDLPEDFQKAIDAGHLAVGVAEVLMSIDNEELRRYYLTNAANHGCTVKTAQLWVSDYEATKAAQYYMSPVDENGMVLTPQMKPIYYACDLCTEPVELSKAKHVLACPICVGKIRSKGVFQA